MDFFKFIQSLDELLFEVLSWLLFYPTTLWRVLVHPVRTLRYAEAELQKEPDEQFSDSLSPPLFLMLTLIIVHVVELSWVGQSEVVKGRSGVNAFVTSDTSIIVLRTVLFGLFPLLLARQFAKASGAPVNRATIKNAFYAQCFATAPFALLISASTLIGRRYGATALWPTLGCLLSGLIWLGLIQTEWFHAKLKIGRWAAFKQSSVVMLQGVVILALLGTFLV
jgi:hypothetical protein